MAVLFTMSIDNALAPGFGGGKRRGERQQLALLLQRVAEQIGDGVTTTATIRDPNLRPGVDPVSVGTFTYTPVATGDT